MKFKEKKEEDRSTIVQDFLFCKCRRGLYVKLSSIVLLINVFCLLNMYFPEIIQSIIMCAKGDHY